VDGTEQKSPNLSFSVALAVRLQGMRKGIIIEVTSADRARLQSIIRDRNSPQKHVWWSRIIVLRADGAGTTTISRAIGKGETVVWRWQERFMHEGVEGLTRDKTRPSRIPPLPAATVDRVVALTNQAPPHEATHWTEADDGHPPDPSAPEYRQRRRPAAIASPSSPIAAVSSSLLRWRRMRFNS